MAAAAAAQPEPPREAPASWEDGEDDNAQVPETKKGDTALASMFARGPFLEQHVVPNAAKLAAASGELLALMNTHIFRGGRVIAARLEYDLRSNMLRLTFSSVVWFDRLVEWSNPAAATTVAVAYVKATRGTHVEEHPSTTSEACPRKLPSAELCKFVKNGGVCPSFAPPAAPRLSAADRAAVAGGDVAVARPESRKAKPGQPCKFYHPSLPVCRKHVVTDDGSNMVCGQYYMNELVLKPTELRPLFGNINNQVEKGGATFYYMARRELMREILVLPRIHRSNAELAVMEEAWKAALQFRGDAAAGVIMTPSDLAYIAMNFGEWESKQRAVKHAIECHAHMHLGFARSALPRLALVPVLKGRTDSAPCYPLQDCIELESARLLASVMADHGERLTALGERLTALGAEVKALGAQVTGLASEVKGLSSQFGTFLQALAEGNNLQAAASKAQQ